MVYTIYRLSDGVVIGHRTCPPRLIAHNTPDGCGAIEGQADPLRFRVDTETKLFVYRDDSPVASLVEHEQALARERIAAIEAGQIRTIREALLGDVAAVERLREQEPAIAAAREVLQRVSTK